MALKANALISEAELEAILRTSLDTSTAEYVINYASQIIETICNRKFIAADYAREVYDIEAPTHYLYLKQFPIVSLVGIYEYDTQTNTLLYTYVANTDYIKTDAKGLIYFHSKLPKSIGSIQVSYNGGYAIADVPYDLKTACAQLAGLLYAKKGSVGIDSESMGNYSVTYSKSLNSVEGIGFPIPNEIYSVLMFYRNDNI